MERRALDNLRHEWDCQRSDRPDPEAHCQPFVELPERVRDLSCVVQDLRSNVGEPVASDRGGERPVGAVDKGHADPGFELLDGMGHRGLRQAELACAQGHASGLRDCNEDFQRVKIETETGHGMDTL